MDGALCSEKVDGECNKEHTGLTRHHVKSPVTTIKEFYHVYRTWDPHAAALRRHFSSSMKPLLSVDGAVRAEKEDEEFIKAQTGLTLHNVNSLVTTSAELYHVYRTWNPHGAALTRHFSSSMKQLFIRGWGLVCRECRWGVQ